VVISNSHRQRISHRWLRVDADRPNDYAAVFGTGIRYMMSTDPTIIPRGARLFGGSRQPSCDDTSRMTRECHVRICERLGVNQEKPFAK
jgi:hypothetical protein